MEFDDEITSHFRLMDVQKRALKKLGLTTIRDLLFHFPTRYENISDTLTVSNLKKGDTAIIYGKISGLKTRKAWRRKVPIAEGYIEDGTGKIKIIWFNQPYIAKMIPYGRVVKVAGKVTGSPRSLYIANPEVESADIIPTEAKDLFSEKRRGAEEEMLFPVYPESHGITSKWFYHSMQRVLKGGVLGMLEDPLPEEVVRRYNLPTLKTALVFIHTPKKIRDSTAARKRFAFEEVFLIQLAKQSARHEFREKKTFSITVNEKDIDSFASRFPFSLTNAQSRAIKIIADDFKKDHPMSRLLEGDVGSGKTAVAAITAYAVVMSQPYGSSPAGKFGNLQTAYMAPTEILARQHFESFVEFFSHLPINIGLITSSGCRKFPSKVNPTKSTTISRAQLLKWVWNGEIPILIGTHALIQKVVKFKNLAYVIIDEQHRFGTMQRQELVRKHEIMPHLLSMTATPIPRTLALTIYGDLDLTLLDEMPKGRKPIITEIVTPSKREETYEKIRKELRNGRQVYVICPRIEEPDLEMQQALNVKSAKEERKRIKAEVFPEYEIGLIHSKLRPKEKEETMQKFLSNEIQVLVATSVVEVGVNVPNATIIVIEGAERFGLAQLHQLRGRVLRSTHQAFCYIFTDSRGKNTMDRLRALKTAKNGFELAEYDLSIRGAGELSGRVQWGISDIGMEAMKNIKMVEAARNEAALMTERDPKLDKHPLLKKRVEQKQQTIHFE
jgi:ATP-dependent DNA helicase RecG